MRHGSLRAVGITALSLLLPHTVRPQAPTRSALRDSIASERRALQQNGPNPGLIQLALARQLYRVGQPAAGRAALIAAAVDTSPEATKAFLDEMLRGMPGILSGKGRWPSMPPADRASYFLSLWDDCDLERVNREGECLREQMQREAWADDHFRLRGLSDTSRWDDRGVVWIKQGAPEVRVRAHGTAQYEIWRYTVRTGSFVLYFRSADGAARDVPMRLVASIEDAPVKIRAKACQADKRACSHGEPIAGHFSASSADTMSKANTGSFSSSPRPLRGGAAMQYATTIHRIPERAFPHPLHSSVQSTALADSAGVMHLIYAFVIPRRELRGVRVGDRMVYTLQFSIGALVSKGRTEHDTAVVVRTERTSPDTMVRGILDFVLPNPRASVYVAVAQPGGRGEVWNDSQLLLGQTVYVGAALVLGRRGSGIRWNATSGEVWFNPVAEYEVGDTVRGFVQVLPQPDMRAMSGLLTLHTGPQALRAHRLVGIEMSIDSSRPRVERTFTLPLDTLPPGTYSLAFAYRRGKTTDRSESLYMPTAVFTITPRKKLP